MHDGVLAFLVFVSSAGYAAEKMTGNQKTLELASNHSVFTRQRPLTRLPWMLLKESARRTDLFFDCSNFTTLDPPSDGCFGAA